jgi:hypothetical protein
MLSGRAPAGLGPSLNIDEVASRVVRWANQDNDKEANNGPSGHVGGDYPSYFDCASRSFITKLLMIHSKERMTVEECLEQSFLKEATPALPTIKDVYQTTPPPLPPMKQVREGGGGGGGGGGEGAKLSFSLVVAPLPSKFVRGDGEGGSGQRAPVVETEAERNMTWVPRREQTMMLKMPVIDEMGEGNGGSGGGGSGGGGSGGGGSGGGGSGGKTSTGMRTTSVGERKEQSKGTMLPPMARFPGSSGGRSGPVRSTGTFPPRSGGPRMMMTTRPPLGGGRNGRRNNGKKNTLFVKGLDLTAG